MCFDRNDTQGVQDVDVARFVHDGNIVPADGEELRMRNGKLAAIRCAENKRPKNPPVSCFRILSTFIEYAYAPFPYASIVSRV
ncbi:MAG TPA: hypothetical protein VN578_23665 [Candidatus Binatia bacterium]|nr:hypothetical protein [Candidatus Binatia bacterium]